MCLSYHHLRLVDVFVCAVAVHRGLALPVLPVPLRHGSELIGRPITIEPVLGLWILNQPIDPPAPEGVASWLDRSRGPRWVSSTASTPHRRPSGPPRWRVGRRPTPGERHHHQHWQPNRGDEYRFCEYIVLLVDNPV
jgi:hypothetical protein